MMFSMFFLQFILFYKFFLNFNAILYMTDCITYAFLFFDHDLVDARGLSIPTVFNSVRTLYTCFIFIL